MTDSTATITERIRQWHRTADLRALWPDVDANGWRLAHERILGVTRDVLGEASVPPILTTSGEHEAHALGVAAFASGMGPLMAWWIERGLVRASPAAREVLHNHLQHGRRRVTAVRNSLAALLARFREADVRPILLKGLHTGAVYFPEPGTRTLTDADLLVTPESADRAADVLRRAGFHELRHTRYGARSEWAPADTRREVRSLEFDHSDNPWNVDLHAGLERWYFRGLRAGFGDEAFGNSTLLALDQNDVAVLRQPLLLAFLALHASYELVKTRLVRIVELVLVIRRDRANGSLDWKSAASLLERTRTARFAYPALALAERLCPGTVDKTLLEHTGMNVTGRMRRVIRAVEAANMAPLLYRSVDDRFMWARGIREWLLNASELAWPSDEALPLGPLRLQWRRLRAVLRGAAGFRARS